MSLTTPKQKWDDEKFNASVKSLTEKIEDFLSKSENNLSKYSLVFTENFDEMVVMKVAKNYTAAGWESVEYEIDNMFTTIVLTRPSNR